MAARLLEHTDFDSHDLSSLRSFPSAARLYRRCCWNSWPGVCPS